MKKFIVIFVALLITMSVDAFGQLMLSKKEVYKTIYGLDNLNNLKNQNLIYPGDTLHYLLFGILPFSPIVEKGDTQVKILSDYIFSENDLLIAFLTKKMLELQKENCQLINQTEKSVRQSKSSPLEIILGILGCLAILSFLTQLILRIIKK